MATLEQLIAERDKLEAQIKEQRETARSDGIKRIREIMDDLGLTTADLRTEPARSSKPARKSTGKGGTVAAKYRDPASGNTWTGRGLMPRWMRETGKPKETFAIAPDA